MKIGLIDTSDKTTANFGPNAAIASLAGYLLKKGHEVGVIDLFFSDEAEQRRFFQREWGLVGITATSFSFNVALDAARAVKALNQSAPPVVIGGAHASVAREDILAEPEFDFVIYGEGETPLLSLTELIEKEKHPSKEQLEGINGLIFRNNGRFIVNAPAGRIADLDSMPMPPYDLFPMSSYLSYTLSTSRGCPYECVYCASAAILGKRWVPKSPGRVVEEIEHVISRYGKRPFSIVDDSFNLEKERVKEFCRLLLERKTGIQWSMCGGMRADKIDLEMLLLMKSSGCSGIGIGVESANPGVLKNIGKAETIGQIRDGIRLIKKAGMRLHASFMIGNPGDTLDTVKESIRFIKSEPLDGVSVFIAVPYPNTGLWRYIKENGRFLRTDYTNYHDHSEDPLFETDDFSCMERVKAYRLANKEISRLRIKFFFRQLPHLIRAFGGRVRAGGFTAALREIIGRYAGKLDRQPVMHQHSGGEFERIRTKFSRQG